MFILGQQGYPATINETVLWTNPSPTANYAAKTQDLDTGMKLSDYTYIKFVYKYAASNTDDIELIVPRTQLENTAQSGSVTGAGLSLGIKNAAGTFGYRRIWYTADTSVGFGSAYLANSTTAYQNFALPYKIIGINIS